MTLPTIVQNYRRQVTETRLAKFYSVVNQAIKRAEVDYGDNKYWEPLGNGFETDENDEPDITKPLAQAWFNKYFRPYMKLTKVESSKADEGKIMAYFPDGSLVLISSTSWLFFPEAKVYKEEYIDGELTATERNKLGGTRLFTFYFYPGKGVEPYHYMLSEDNLKQGTQACTAENRYERAYCVALIQKNGWKIPKDYPLKF